MKRSYIITEKQPTKNVIHAANQLKKYLKKACGLDFFISNNDEVCSGTYIISLGINQFSIAHGYNKNFSDGLAEGEYVITSKGNKAFIFGKEDVQILYGVYGFLEKTINFSAVAPDEITYDVCEFNVPSEDIRYTPAIPNFSIGAWDTDNALNTSGGFQNAALYKMLQAGCHTGGGDLERDWWGLWSHTQFTVLPPSKYAEEHPEWYSEDKEQLCLTNEKMTEQFTENLKEIILAKPKAKYFQLGAMDVPRVCGCEKCQREAKLYEKGGIMLRFFRKVAESIDAWAKKKIPERKYKLSILAYFDFTFAPSTKNEQTGLYEANDPSFIMPDNVSVMFAPLEMCYGHALNDESCPINTWYYNALQSWLPLTKDLMIWSYSTNFDNFAVPLNDYRKSMRENFKLYKELNVSYVFVHANFHSKFELFHKMRVYILSQLMQDPEKQIKDLVRIFMDKYYKQASSYMQKCFYLIEDNFERIEKEYNQKGKHLPTFVYVFNFDEEDGVYHELNKENYWRKKFTGKNIFQEKFFPKELLDEVLFVINQALSEIEKIENDMEREKIYNRVLIETIPIKMLRNMIYKDTWTAQEKNDNIFEFKCLIDYFNLKTYSEINNRTFDSIIKEWEA